MRERYEVCVGGRTTAAIYAVHFATVNLIERESVGHLLELPKYAVPSDNENEEITDPLEQWAYFFRRAGASTAEELNQRLADPVFAEATGVLEMIAKSPEERRYYEARLKMQRDEQARMEAARDQGLAEGEARGRAEGEVMGRAEGEAIGRAEGEAIGRAEGEVRGEAIGRVRVLQQLAGLPESSVDVLRQHTLEELAAIESELQRILRERS